MNELRNRGVHDILIAVVDGLKGFPEAITGVFPETTVQTCIVHLTRFSLAYCSWQDRKAVAGELKNIYRAASAEVRVGAGGYTCGTCGFGGGQRNIKGISAENI